jgi:hypothetical protein
MRIRSYIRVSVRIGRGKTKRLELIEQPSGKKFWLRVNGKNSRKFEETTITEFTDQLRRWIARQK